MLGPGFDTEGNFLKRKICWTDEGVTWEADSRHALAIIERWATSTHSKCKIPLGPETSKMSEGNELDKDLAKEFRGVLPGYSIYHTIDRT